MLPVHQAAAALRLLDLLIESDGLGDAALLALARAARAALLAALTFEEKAALARRMLPGLRMAAGSVRTPGSHR
jgi:hypothetical protein